MNHYTQDQVAEAEAAKDQQIHSATEHLFNKFDWSKRIGEVTEILNNETPIRIDSALAAFMQMDSLTLRLMLDSVAMELCECEARRLVSAHGKDWILALEFGL